MVRTRDSHVPCCALDHVRHEGCTGSEVLKTPDKAARHAGLKGPVQLQPDHTYILGRKGTQQTWYLLFPGFVPESAVHSPTTSFICGPCQDANVACWLQDGPELHRKLWVQTLDRWSWELGVAPVPQPGPAPASQPQPDQLPPPGGPQPAYVPAMPPAPGPQPGHAPAPAQLPPPTGPPPATALPSTAPLAAPLSALQPAASALPPHPPPWKVYPFFQRPHPTA